MKPDKRKVEARDRGNIIEDFSETLRSISVSEGKFGALNFRRQTSQCHAWSPNPASRRMHSAQFVRAEFQAGFAHQACLEKQDEAPGLAAAPIQYIVRRTMYNTTSSEPGNRVRKHEESPGSQGQDAS